MTESEIATCLRHFAAHHSISPTVLILSARIYDELYKDFAYNDSTGEVFCLGVRVLRDPVIHGIAISTQ